MAKRVAVFVALVVLAPWLAISSLLVPLDTKPTPTQIPAGLTVKDLPPPVADAGWDIVTYVGLATMFGGRATPGHGKITKYEWDFNGDGTYDWSSSQRRGAAHTYLASGTYRAAFRVTDEYGLFWTDRIEVTVNAGKGRQKYIKPPSRKPRFFKGLQTKNGTVNKYAIIINCAGGERFWIDADTLYDALHDHLGIDDDAIYFLNHNGTDNWGNEDDRIDYPAHPDSIDEVFRRLAEEDSIDADDHLFIMITGHGSGFCDPRVQQGDEPDSLESEFSPAHDFKLDDWWSIQASFPNYHRYKYLSHFDTTYFEINPYYRADDDIWIEWMIDYLAGDSVLRDGVIDTSVGEVVDFDGDGNPPYDPDSGIFDEDDWGNYDNVSEYWHEKLDNVIGQLQCCVFDSALDDEVDVDVVCDSCDSVPDAPNVDGTDTDNDGYFDGVDMNSDGDKSDWVSLDEAACAYGGNLWDDHLAELLDSLGERPTLAVFMNCYSGGFVWDLSGPQQVTMTPCSQYTPSYGNTFIRKVADPIIDPEVADSIDIDGCASMTEVFNYICNKGNNVELYDDNGDHEGHPYPIVRGSSDGAWGRVFLFHDCYTQGYLLYYSHSCSDSVYDDNEAINPEDTVHMSVTLEHTGLTSATAQSVVCTLRTDFSYITLLDSTASFGDIDSADTATSTDVFSFAVSSSCPDSSQVDFDLYAYTGDTLAGVRTFSQMIYKPYFTMSCEPGTLVAYFTPFGKQSYGGGGGSGVDLILTPHEGFGSTVTLSCSGVCDDIIASIIPTQLTPPDTSVLSFGQSLFCQPQICSTIVVKATGGGVTCYDTVTYVLRNNPVNDLVFYVSPDGHDLWDGKEDYPLRTIQKGVEWADAGDTVLVEQGTYEEHVVIYKDNIVVTSYYSRDEQESYIESTIIDGVGSGPVVRIDTSLGVTLCGFTIKNGGSIDPGHGIYCDNSTADLLYNGVTDSYCGIRSYQGDSLYLFRNMVYCNTHFGIQLEDGSGLEVINNSIAENGFAGLNYDNSTSNCKNNIISENVYYGIFMSNEALASMSFNDVWGNASNYAGGYISDSTGYNGNISQDPLLAYPEGGNLHIAFSSPCRDSGDTLDTPPEGGGDRIDMGAIEFIPCEDDTACGDVNVDCRVDWGDYYYLLNYFYYSGPAPARVCLGDVNCDGDVAVGDLTYLDNYLSGEGPPPCDTCCVDE